MTCSVWSIRFSASLAAEDRLAITSASLIFGKLACFCGTSTGVGPLAGCTEGAAP
jgi:hypothetical protein